MVNNSIAIIPARGGSKRIPEKNIVDFNGIPMIAKTIQAAKKTNLFRHVLVSTDDEKIAAVAKKYGAEVPFWRENYCDDFATVSQATIYAIKQAEEFYQEKYDVVVQLMANCPLRTTAEIINSYNYFMDNVHDFQISCFKFGWMNPWWAMTLDDDMKAEKLFPETGEKRSQDLQDLFCPTGAIWIANVEALKQSGTFYGDNYRAFPIEWTSAVDIDNYDDLKMARLLDNMNKEDEE